MMKVLAIVTGVTGSLLIFYGSIVQGSPGMMLFLVGLTTLLIVPVTALLCRHRIMRGMRISYGTAVAGGLGATFIAFTVTLLRVARLENWTPAYWGCLFIGYALFSLFCVLPALGVVRHYQERSKR